MRAFKVITISVVLTVLLISISKCMVIETHYYLHKNYPPHGKAKK